MDYSVANGRAIAATPDPLVAELGPGVQADVPFPENPPLVLRPRGGELAESIEAASHWFARRADVIDWLLVRHGALLLRGFPVPDTNAFARLLSHYRPHAAGYTGGATPREAIKGTVYEATQVPPGVTILLHQEMAYLKGYPVKLAFFCISRPATGGDTTVADFRRFMAGLPDRFLRELDEKGVTYHRSFRVPGVPHPLRSPSIRSRRNASTSTTSSRRSSPRAGWARRTRPTWTSTTGPAARVRTTSPTETGPRST
jgi:alpha-ketoglutarate-dependent taurine dioxygenase